MYRKMVGLAQMFFYLYIMKTLTTPLILLALSLVSQAQPTAESILKQAIAYHDPQSNWKSFSGTFYLEEHRSAGVMRSTTFGIDNSKGYFIFTRGETEHGMYADSCFVVKGNADCDRVATIRNFYLYLWGLPMKLQDAGTVVQPDVLDTLISDQPVFGLTVAYEQDTWTYFFAKSNYAMVAYQFMFNTKPGGEVILLEGEYLAGSIRFPKTRKWFELPGMKYLGKDILQKIQ